MEARVTRLEGAFLRVDASLNDIKASQARTETRLDHIDGRLDGIDGRLVRMDGRLEGVDSRLGRSETSQARLEERMERVMDKARDMPSEDTVNKLLNHKLTILGIITAILVVALPYLLSKA